MLADPSGDVEDLKFTVYDAIHIMAEKVRDEHGHTGKVWLVFTGNRRMPEGCEWVDTVAGRAYLIVDYWLQYNLVTMREMTQKQLDYLDGKC